MIKILLSDPLARNQQKIKRTVEKAVPFILNEFKIPANKCVVLIDPIAGEKPGSTTLGASWQVTSTGEFVCEINSAFRHDAWSVIETMAHEFTHIRQMMQSRLRTAPGKVYWYENDTFLIYNRDVSYQEYLNFPWEIEARECANEFIMNHFNAIIRQTVLDTLAWKIKNFFTRGKKRG
jgi:hypothetical protein